MKKFLLGISMTVLFTACQTNKKDALDIQKDLLPVNNANLYNSSILTDTGIVKRNQDEVSEEIQYVKPVRRKKIVRVVQAVEPAPAPVVVVNNPPVVPETPAPVINAPVESNTGNTESGNTGTTSNTEPKKKGWSSAAKGAVIGGVGGAVAGAVINGKNRGKGAIIGGVIGAAGGYILGRKKDKKEDEGNLVAN